ncbi:hypothetical protein N0V83_004686 [Neocucurbitaria cava]|uniref:Uncharacterized protein n=1 Tax=Neocucurbitaria cava TaxID=798079 RepID=A0A9W8Y9L4_9PLEO|nr:hypothetical protein N0V83_004686 [Neocucurbitaria cava]
MSANTEADVPYTAQVATEHLEVGNNGKVDNNGKADILRKTQDTMSLAHILSPDTPDVTAGAHELVRPSTPVNPTTLLKDEVLSPDTAMSDIDEPADAGKIIEGVADRAEGAKCGQDLAEGDEGAGDVMDIDDADREFVCMNDEWTPCKTGQHTMDLARKVISDHFGRNKACTRDIQDWPLFCRKHYQRATYDKEKWQLRKMALVIRQFDVIEKQFPGTTYDINFKKSEENRLNQYSRHVAAGMANTEAEKKVAPGAGKHFEAPIDVLRELDQWLGKGKSCAEVKNVADVILQMLEEKETEQVPAIEFLPQLPGKLYTPKKTPVKSRVSKSPRTPKTPKTPQSSKMPKTPKTPTRVSTKGSIKKPLQQVKTSPSS